MTLDADGYYRPIAKLHQNSFDRRHLDQTRNMFVFFVVHWSHQLINPGRSRFSGHAPLWRYKVQVCYVMSLA